MTVKMLKDVIMDQCKCSIPQGVNVNKLTEKSINIQRKEVGLQYPICRNRGSVY